MWINDPMPVMTRIISADSGSTRRAKGIWRSPEAIQVKTVCWSQPTLRSASAATSEMPNAAIIARHATAPEIAFGNRRPMVALMRKPTKGSSKISDSTGSPFEQRERVRAQRLFVPEERNHQRQADRRFRRGDRHDEERDDLSVDR